MMHYTLYELNEMVRQTLELEMPGEYWVEAELSEVREVRGHCYMELVQSDMLSSFFSSGGGRRGAAPVARASAKCWQSSWMKLRPRFERVTGQPLSAGMQVLLRVAPNFHEAYGFSWIVSDIDPTFTLGDMARRRQEIIRTLKEEGVYDLQKELLLSPFARRVAVISSENAAGYGDFCNQLADNEYGFVFQTRLFPAVMQGEQVEQTVIAALNRINDEQDQFDVVVIIRGGGATADLSGFDTLPLAENVANFPLPIITGIGHDRDESVLDMISHTRVKTPTAAAAFLVDQLATTWRRIERAQETILNRIGERLRAEQLRLTGMAGRIPVMVLSVVGDEQLRLRRLQERLTSGVPARLQTMRHRIETLSAVVVPLVERRMMTERHRLELFEQRVKALDPALLLQRGYSITLKDGHAVRAAEELRPGDVIETKVEKGTIQSIVQ